MNTKFKNKAQQSKLNLAKKENEEKLFPTSAKNDYLFSFRFDPQMWEDLHHLLNQINQQRLKPVKLSQLIRVLLKQSYALNSKQISKKLLSLL